jgi:hypothetical protein
MPQGQYECKTEKWKNKAKLRCAENKKLRRSIVELRESRDNWKSKYLALKKQGNISVLNEEKAVSHQYPLWIVLFVVLLQRYGGMSLRSCRHCLVCMSFVGLSFRIPSHNSIRHWACKCGYFRVNYREVRKSSYVVYVDESIVFGSEKILLILGLPVDKIPVGRSVFHSDMDVLYVGMSDSWTGEVIASELDKINEKTPISYIVSDEGCNLRNAYKVGNYTHIEDCTHILSNMLKRFYEKNVEFELFSSFVGKTRQSFYLSKEKSKYLPPCLRGKLRFINVFSCVAWAKNLLDWWEELPCDVRESLSFLKQQQGFIEELSQQHFIFIQVCSVLKNKGFSFASKCEIKEALASFGKSENAKKFVSEIGLYLDNLSEKCDSLGIESCLCSSDIIESLFGKFKQKINPNNKNQLSEFVLTIANFTKEFDKNEVKKALENVKINDLKNYKMNNKNRTKK